MQKWDYLHLIYSTAYDTPTFTLNNKNMLVGKRPPPLFEVLNQLGEEGWELVAKDVTYYLFKRPK